MTHASGIVSKLLGEDDQYDLPLPGQSDPDVSLPDPAEIAGKALKDWSDRREHGKPVSEHSVTDHGVMNGQYFQGAGVSHSRFDEVFTGSDFNAHSALEDALEQAAMSGWDVRSIDNEFDPEATDVDDAVREANPDMDEDDIEVDDVGAYVSLYLKSFGDDEPIGESKGPEFKTLKKGRKSLSDEDRKVAIKAGATWSQGKDGKPTCAIWQSDVDGKTWYVSNTHRLFQSRSTLKAAIKAFHDAVKPSA